MPINWNWERNPDIYQYVRPLSSYCCLPKRRLLPLNQAVHRGQNDNTLPSGRTVFAVVASISIDRTKGPFRLIHSWPFSRGYVRLTRRRFYWKISWSVRRWNVFRYGSTLSVSRYSFAKYNNGDRRSSCNQLLVITVPANLLFVRIPRERH